MEVILTSFLQSPFRRDNTPTSPLRCHMSNEAIEDQQKRSAIREVYKHSASWHDKVDKMSTAQVIAIYLRFKREGKIN